MKNWCRSAAGHASILRIPETASGCAVPVRAMPSRSRASSSPNRVRVSRMIKAYMTRHWVSSAAQIAGCARSSRLGRQGALAENDVIAVESLEPAVQHLQDRLGVFFVVGSRADQLAADRQRIAKPAAVEIDGQLRAPRCEVFRIERRSPVEGLYRLLEPTQTIKQVTAMQMVFGDGRGDRQRPIDRLERLFRPPALAFAPPTTSDERRRPRGRRQGLSR